MADPTDGGYILIEDSRNLDDVDTGEKQGDIHDKNEAASQRTLDQQGIIIKQTTPATADTARPSKVSFLKRLLDQGGVEILPNKNTGEGEFDL